LVRRGGEGAFTMKILQILPELNAGARGGGAGGGGAGGGISR
jgi:hypothetical protein